MNKKGCIIKIVSNLYTVDIDSTLYECRARGKFRNDSISPLVGDFCLVDIEHNYILEIFPRKNELKRPQIANVDVGLVITSTKDPDLSLNLLDKELLVITNANIEPIICLTKEDLLSSSARWEIKEIFKYYKALGYKVITNKQLYRLKHLIKNKVVVLTGQTGAGKSTLLNRLDKNLDLKTSSISKALGRGVHTTRHVELFKVAKSLIADTPGFSALDLNFDTDRLKSLYPEFKNYNCKFDDCNHVNEKDCGVKKAVEDGKIKNTRYENYLKFRGELK